MGRYGTRLTSRQFAVFQLIVLLADKATGVWWGDSVAVTTYFRDLNVKAAKTTLSELEAKGYIKRFRQQGSRSSYPILVNKYEITVGGLKGRRVSAEQTVDWRTPVAEELTETGTDTVTEAGTGTGREGGPPYSRPQDLQDRESTTEQYSAERGSVADRHASHDLEPKAKATPRAKPSRRKTADKIRAEVAKLITLPLEERQKAIEAGELTHMLPHELEAAERFAHLYADLSGKETSPDPFVVFLYGNPVGGTPECERYSFPCIAAVLTWAFRESNYWPKELRDKDEQQFCDQYDKIARQYEKFYQKAGFWPHEYDTTILNGLIPDADSEAPLCAMCGENRTSVAPFDAWGPATNADGYYLNCDECDPPSTIPAPPAKPVELSPEEIREAEARKRFADPANAFKPRWDDLPYRGENCDHGLLGRNCPTCSLDFVPAHIVQAVAEENRL